MRARKNRMEPFDIPAAEKPEVIASNPELRADYPLFTDAARCECGGEATGCADCLKCVQKGITK